MSKYINADELTEELEKFREIKDSECCQGINAMLDTALMIIHNLTLGDEIAEKEKKEVKHGKWIEEPSMFPNHPFVRCSECGEEALLDEYGVAKSNFCPNCGADMVTRTQMSLTKEKQNESK